MGSHLPIKTVLASTALYLEEVNPERLTMPLNADTTIASLGLDPADLQGVMICFDELTYQGDPITQADVLYDVETLGGFAQLLADEGYIETVAIGERADAILHDILGDGPDSTKIH